MAHKEIKIGMIGGGYMGKQHSLALCSVGPTFNTKLRPKLEMIAATSAQKAKGYAQEYGYARSTDNWRNLIHDDKVDAVVIASPAATQYEIAMEVIAAGKPCFCEKPMAAKLEQGLEMADAAEKAGIVTMVGYNYAKTPATQYARKLIADGEIGDITYLRCEHTEDFHADPQAPWWWRDDGLENGTLGELAVHIINAALALGGPIESLVADIDTVHKERPAGNGKKPVTNDDHAQFIFRYKNGAFGHLYSSRIATGRKMGYIYEVFGTKGSIRFDQEDQNSIWLYKMDAQEAQRGFVRILTGPAHPDFAPINLGAAHGTGFGDQITIEMKDFLQAIETGRPGWPSFRDGAEVLKIVEAAWRSHEGRTWVDLI